jgi:hypothetical protein
MTTIHYEADADRGVLADQTVARTLAIAQVDA